MVAQHIYDSENQERAIALRIPDFLNNNPGVTFGEIARYFQVSLSTIVSVMVYRVDYQTFPVKLKNVEGRIVKNGRTKEHQFDWDEFQKINCYTFGWKMRIRLLVEPPGSDFYNWFIQDLKDGLDTLAAIQGKQYELKKQGKHMRDTYHVAQCLYSDGYIDFDKAEETT